MAFGSTKAFSIVAYLGRPEKNVGRLFRGLVVLKNKRNRKPSA